MTQEKKSKVIVEGIETGTDDKVDLVVFNDDFNEFEFVIKCFMDICKLDYMDAYGITLYIHTHGVGTVRSGSYQEIKPMKEALVECGLTAIISRGRLN